MKRRAFVAALMATPVAAQDSIKGVVSNLDRHGMAHNMVMHANTAEMATTPVTNMVQPVLTRSGGNLREGAYLAETTFTPAGIKSNPPKKLFTITLPGDARGLEAQPLIAPNITVADGTAHDLVISSTMGNQVYAHDAHTGTPMWQIRLGNPIVGSTKIDGWMINQYWGVLSTGAISGTKLYVVGWTSSDGTTANAYHKLYEINLADGSQTRKPIQLTTPATIERKQRSSLTIIGTKLFIPWGTIQETADGAHGFVTCIDLTGWTIQKEWNATANGNGAGIWMAGQAPSTDGTYLYFLTGNGDYGIGNYGECFIKMDLNLNVVDFWSPFKDADRGTGGGWDDMDLGSGGCILIPPLNLVIGCGKDGILYVLNSNNLKAGPVQPPIFFTFNGLGLNPTPANVKDLNTLVNGKTHHMHSTPVYWNGNLFCWGENGNGRWWKIDKTGKVTYVGRTAEMASPYAPATPGGMPGSMMCLSSNGTTNGILWACVPDGDANSSITTGRVFAFDVNTIGAPMADGDLEINRLWMSDPDYTFNKFNVPVVSAGKLYVPTYDATIEVWG